MRKLRRSHGLEGVGLYWMVLELIVADIDAERFTFDLEHDAELIADDAGISREKVEAIMTTMVSLGLFECSDGVITCMKLLKRMDSSQVKNADMRKLIQKAKESAPHPSIHAGHGGVMAGSWRGHDRREEKRTEQTRSEEKRIPLPDKDSTRDYYLGEKSEVSEFGAGL